MNKIKILLVVLFALLMVVGCVRESDNDNSQSRINEYIGIYRHEHEHNTDTLIEDHYIVLDIIDEELVGRYYGTSDEFDEAREGYYPGFFVLDMQNLVIDRGHISFSLVLKENETFEFPVDIEYKSSSEISLESNPLWINSHMQGERTYEGTIEHDKITLNFGYDTRVLIRQKAE